MPPVATLTGGVPDLIDDRVDGFMEDVGDIDAQSARLIELLTDEAMHSRMAAAARRKAEARFCTDLIIPKYENFYRKVIEGR